VSVTMKVTVTMTVTVAVIVTATVLTMSAKPYSPAIVRAVTQIQKTAAVKLS